MGAGAYLAARAHAERAGTDVENFQIEIPKTRLLADLALRQVDRVPPGPGEVELRVEAVGLNYKDSMKIVGMLTERELAGTYFGMSVGMEVAAEVVRVGHGVNDVGVGDKVVVFAPGMLRKYVTLPVQNCGRIGVRVSADELADPTVAATYDPLVCGSQLPFLTAIYGLRTLARLRPGEIVLIHGAAGGMGQAAVQVALRMGAIVIGTASSPQRRDFVRQAGAHHVLNSRSVSFVDEVLQLTRGHGADVIYTSAQGEIGAQNLRVAAEFGRIVDIGKADIYTDGLLELRPFDRNLSFFAVDMDRAMAVDSDMVWNPGLEAVEELTSGRYRWLPYRRFTLDELEEAFEAVARADSIGRVVVDFRTEPARVRPPVDYVDIRPGGTYLITGGFGAFGLATARWLVRAGARRLVLAGRHGASSESAQLQLADFATMGVEVVEERLDLADYDATAELIARIEGSGHPLRGVFHAAGVVNMVPVSDLSRAELDAVVAPKARGGENLYRAVTAAGVKPDVVVLYSSISAWGIMEPQLSYASANYALDALAAMWRRQGVRALAVNWGYMSGGGMSEGHEALSTYIKSLGHTAIDMDRATTLLSEVLSFGVPQAGIVDVDWTQWAPGYEGIARSHRFAQLFADAGVTGRRPASALAKAIAAAPPKERVDMIVEKLASELATVLGISATTIDVDAPMTELGMDSLTAMEFGARSERELNIQIKPFELNRAISIRGLAAKLVWQLLQQAGAEGAAS
jgi:NADPH:quinone reductase-like Zn-dependent oxidoreductase/acyl carrier protein